MNDNIECIGCRALLEDLAFRTEARDVALKEVFKLKAELDRVRGLIQKVLDDSESRPGGWGPDVTCVGYLEEAMK